MLSKEDRRAPENSVSLSDADALLEEFAATMLGVRFRSEEMRLMRCNKPFLSPFLLGRCSVSDFDEVMVKE